ncbi:MAG: hypothetical protein R3D27_13075 [Hyphomicrobiaceae bacterium]
MRPRYLAAGPFAGRHVSRLALVAGAAVALGGCFHTGPYPGTAYVGAPRQIAHMAVPPRRALEMEDDGLPVQRPPVRRAGREEDDPSQPWSPNYGKRPDTGRRASEPRAEPAPYVAPVPAEPRRRAEAGPPAASKVRFDADAIIAKAIAMHEVYNQ